MDRTWRVADRRGLVLAAAAVVLLTAISLLAIAATATLRPDAMTGAMPAHRVPATGCSVPSLPGATVSVRLVDMSAMMVRGGMAGASGSLLGPGQWRSFHRGMMRVVPGAASVPAGTVSLRATNAGYLTHELVVLPLPAGQQPGGRAVGSDGEVDENGSLGEASASCAAGSGDGIVAGSTGWLSLRLPAGRYELLCNLPGHYAAGMYAELDVR